MIWSYSMDGWKQENGDKDEAETRLVGGIRVSKNGKLRANAFGEILLCKFMEKTSKNRNI